ncbi:MAG TPA: hypothetical protein VGG99_05640 [Acetobacteraceae bacterium]|jgi:hypothetical protein
MTEQEYARKLDELDRLINDPDVPMDPSRVWSLLADLSGSDRSGHAPHEGRPPPAAMHAAGSAD